MVMRKPYKNQIIAYYKNSWFEICKLPSRICSKCFGLTCHALILRISVFSRACQINTEYSFKVRVKLAELSWHTWLILDLGTQYFDIWDTFQGNNGYCKAFVKKVGHSWVRLICRVLVALHFMHITESVFLGVSHQPAFRRLTLTLTNAYQKS